MCSVLLQVWEEVLFAFSGHLAPLAETALAAFHFLTKMQSLQVHIHQELVLPQLYLLYCALHQMSLDVVRSLVVHEMGVTGPGSLCMGG